MPDRQSNLSRREFIKTSAVIIGGTMVASALPLGTAAGSKLSSPAVQQGDLVYICNEDSNTLTVIDPISNTVKSTVNLTSFDEDARPPFRFMTGGIIPTHAGMVTKPLYHGAINIHGSAPSPDQTLLATTGRGTSNIYLIDARKMSIIGNRPNPRATEATNQEIISSGILVGREPHEPSFSRNGKEVWVALRGEDRLAILDTEKAKKESTGVDAGAIRMFLPTVLGPSQTWFSKDGKIAFVISQKVPEIDVFQTNLDSDGFSHPTRIKTINIKAQDPYAFTPFQKITRDGQEMWFSHKIADALSSRSIHNGQELLDYVPLGKEARPNHLEFVENSNGKVVYASLARVDDGGPGGAASSRIVIIDRAANPGQRQAVGSFFSHGREAHGIWTNPGNDLLYIAHEQDELPGTPHEGQTVCTVFDVSKPLKPAFIKQIPLGYLELPSGKLRNKKSINLIYLRPGSPLHSG